MPPPTGTNSETDKAGMKKPEPDGVIRFEIDNVTAMKEYEGRWDDGQYSRYSQEVVANGMPWRMEVSRCDYRLNMCLKSMFNQLSPWEVNVEAECTLINIDSRNNLTKYGKRKVLSNRDDVKFNYFLEWNYVVDANKGFINDGKITVEMRFWISNMKGIRNVTRFDFTDPNDPRYDITLVIQGEKIFVSKRVLALHSPVFNAMFYGNFSEKNKKEIELNDVNPEEFLEMLHVIYPSNKMVTEDSVEYLLKLGDRFQIMSVIESVEFRLSGTMYGFTNDEMLKIADKYRLYGLTAYCCDCIYDDGEVKEIEESSFFNSFSDSTNAAILERKLELASESPSKKIRKTDKTETEDTNPDGIIRFEISNISALDFTGRSSHEIEVKGLYWRLNVYNGEDNKLSFYLSSTNPQSTKWTADLNADFTLFNLDCSKNVVKQGFIGDTFIIDDIIKWNKVMNEKGFINDNKITVEIRFWISNMKGIRTFPRIDFTDPDEPRHDITLVIEGEKIYASKQMLAFLSPVFDNILYGDFAEKGEKEIVLNDVNREEFLEMLHVIYPSNKKIADDSVEYLLELGERFQITSLTDRAEQYLIDSIFSNKDKLRIAEKYGLCGLKNHSISKLEDSDEFNEIRESSFFSDLSDATKLALFDRLLLIFKNKE